jgi:hypothetical protein
MPTIQVEARLSSRDLLEAAEQLDPAELHHLVTQLLGLRARRQAPRLSAAEADLLLRINQGLPDELRRPYQALIAKRRAQALTADEHAELLRLSGQVEQREADRLEALTELARLRGTTLREVLDALGIRGPSHD